MRIIKKPPQEYPIIFTGEIIVTCETCHAELVISKHDVKHPKALCAANVKSLCYYTCAHCHHNNNLTFEQYSELGVFTHPMY